MGLKRSGVTKICGAFDRPRYTNSNQGLFRPRRLYLSPTEQTEFEGQLDELGRDNYNKINH